jgi:hypothetical protein
MARIGQERIDVWRQPTNTQAARVTNLVIENLDHPDNTQNARVTQVVIEVMFKNTVGLIWNPFVCG